MDYTEKMSEAEKVNEVIALIGTENIKDFRVAVKQEYGTPDKWDLSDEAFMNKARLCAMWNFEKTVVRARYIAAVMDLELYKDRGGIDGYGQGENVMYEFPEWARYDTSETLRHYAEKILNEYGHGYDEFLAKNGIVPGQLKSDVVAVYKDNFFYDYSESIIGNGILLDSAGTEWDCFNLLDNIDDSDSREVGGNAYWCICWDGSIGYTEDNGYNVRWDFKPIQD